MVVLWNESQQSLIPQAAGGYPDVKRMLEIHFVLGRRCRAGYSSRNNRYC